MKLIKLLLFLFTLTFAIVMLSMPALAETEMIDLKSLESKISSDGNGWAFSDSEIKISNAGSYIITGIANFDFSVEITAPDDDVEIILDGAKFTASAGKNAINHDVSGKNLTLTLEGSSSISGGSSVTEGTDGGHGISAQNLTIRGNGTLEVMGGDGVDIDDRDNEGDIEGTNGSSGGFGICSKNLFFSEDSVVISIGGKGGDGGTGSSERQDGGLSGDGGFGIFGENIIVFENANITSIGGNGGEGGHGLLVKTNVGGNGSDGGLGGSGIFGSTIIVSGNAVIDSTGGSGGNGEAGLAGGDGGFGGFGISGKIVTISENSVVNSIGGEGGSGDAGGWGTYLDSSGYGGAGGSGGFGMVGETITVSGKTVINSIGGSGGIGGWGGIFPNSLNERFGDNGNGGSGIFGDTIIFSGSADVISVGGKSNKNDRVDDADGAAGVDGKGICFSEFTLIPTILNLGSEDEDEFEIGSGTRGSSGTGSAVIVDRNNSTPQTPDLENKPEEEVPQNQTKPETPSQETDDSPSSTPTFVPIAVLLAFILLIAVSVLIYRKRRM